MEKENQKIYDIAVIGGGASGMMASIFAAKNGANVIVVEKNTQLGRKILATGNGRCNLTNRFAEVNRYHGGNPDFIKSVLAQFDQFATMKFFESLGLVLKEEANGRIFPRTDEAKTVVDALIYELEKNKVETILNDQARKIEMSPLLSKEGQGEVESDNNIFKITLQSGKIIESKKLIMTTGGMAAPQLGTSGDAYFWLEKMGHKIINRFPALSPLEIKETWPKEIQGLKVEANVKTSVDGKIINEKFGDALFTHFGLSGPAAMAQAGSIGENIGKADIKVHLDLFPNDTVSILDDKIKKIIEGNGAKQIKNTLSGLIPSNLAPMLLTILDINPDKKSAEISKVDRQRIAEILKNIELTVNGVLPFKDAQVTHGGVELDEINVNTLESKIVPGLFIAGELLNVDGDSGGFNLQWAWSSGHLAGMSASK